MGATRTYEISRLSALSDGVFAIVLTLLVLDLKLPDPPAPGANISEELRDNLPDLLAWVVSFVVIARFWIIHHDVAARLGRCRPQTIVANFAFLGAVSLVPFGASLAGAYNFDEPLAVLMFLLALGVSAVLLGAFTWCAAGETDAVRGSAVPGGHGMDAHLRHHLIVVPVLAGVSLALVVVEPMVAAVVWIVEAAVVTGAVMSGRWEPGGPPAGDGAAGDGAAGGDGSDGDGAAGGAAGPERPAP